MTSSPDTSGKRPRCNVLLPISGRKAYLCDILGASPRCGVIVATDSDPYAAIRETLAVFARVPPVAESTAYVEAIVRLVQQHGIDCIMPQNDLDLDVLARLRPVVAESATTVLGVDAERVAVFSDKLALSGWLDQRGFHSPETVLLADLGDSAFPLIAKARCGQGSAGLSICHAASDLARAGADSVVQPLLQGVEYNLDILRAPSGEVVSVVPKQKLAMKYGSTDKAVSVASPSLIDLGIRLGGETGHTGSIDVDVMVVDDRPYVLDINPRVGGGFPFTARCCPQYVDALLAIGLGESPAPFLGEYRAGVVVYRDFHYVTASVAGPAGER
jgi:carbamoyl-phosphate synthase large subunit